MDDSIMILPMITEHEGRPVTTSRIVAEQFGKQHKDVLRSIENLRAQLAETSDGAAFNERNFAPVRYRDEKGESRPMYLLSRDGFTLLAMGFTGQKALQFKVAYINAFNRMERLLSGDQSAALPEHRPQYLPTVAATGGETAVCAFLSAVIEALKSGAYHLRPEDYRWNKTPLPGALLGFVYGNRVDLFAVDAYQLYAATVDKPVSRPALWGMLQSSGVIYPKRSKHPKYRKCAGMKHSVITLDIRYLQGE